MKKLFFTFVSVLLVLAIFYFLGREFFTYWDTISSYSFNFNIPILIASSLVYILSLLFLAIGWHLILRYLHNPIPLLYSILYFFITFPSRYVPGKIWLAVARMKFCKKHDVPHSVTLLSTGTEAVLEILAGSYVSLIAILQMPMLGAFSLWGTIVISGLGLLLVWPPVFYFFINLYLKIVKKEPIIKIKHASFPALVILQIIYIGGMFSMGLSQLLFLQSFAPVGREHFPVLIGIGAFSYVAGILALFAPSGLGVREGIWYLVLKTITAPHVALIYSAVSRFWTIAVEALLVFISIPALLYKEYRSRNFK